MTINTKPESSNNLKKFSVLFCLFVAPLLFYVFLSKGSVNYRPLPTLQNITSNDISTIQPKTGQYIHFKNHITVLTFLGNDPNTIKPYIFNINEIIYKRFYYKPFFQMISIVPKGTNISKIKSDLEQLNKDINDVNDYKGWFFIEADKKNIHEFYNKLYVETPLDDKISSPNAFIFGLKGNQRGRKKIEDPQREILVSYDMRQVSILKNKMRDDINIIYYDMVKSSKKLIRK